MISASVASGRRAPAVLVIAESDPSGAAGIQGDLTTLAVIGRYGMAVPTALTVPGDRKARAVHPLSPAIAAASIRALLEELPIDAVKIGMLNTAEMARAVAGALRGYRGPLVVDPVTHRVERGSYVDKRLRGVLLDLWIPRATVVTPNLNAASALCGVEVRDLDMMLSAGQALHDLGARCVLVKGGGLDGDPVDALVDAHSFALLWGTRHHLPRTRGGGSAISTAIAAALAAGLDPRGACIEARCRLDRALATDHPIGRGGRAIAHHALRIPAPTAAGC
ncbi:MAG: hydroxymethylpyrimidine/phosphomethylpyrimidine kinase [Deltaproteobacteria bacterium]|nr:hydroxymethylpyrimidine/phosphomethylpyrimidine kinase [Deltaproteobacteria bacterium]